MARERDIILFMLNRTTPSPLQYHNSLALFRECRKVILFPSEIGIPVQSCTTKPLLNMRSIEMQKCDSMRRKGQFQSHLSFMVTI